MDSYDKTIITIVPSYTTCLLLLALLIVWAKAVGVTMAGTAMTEPVSVIYNIFALLLTTGSEVFRLDSWLRMHEVSCFVVDSKMYNLS